MRDLEFKQEFLRLTPWLLKLFSKVVRSYRGDRAVQVKDLLQDTAKAALINSRSPTYDGYTCKQLITRKAYNLVHEYGHPPQRKVPVEPMEAAAKKAGPQDLEQELINKRRLEEVYAKVPRRSWIICYLDYEGYKREEIADHLGISEEAVNSAISRVRGKLKRRG